MTPPRPTGDRRGRGRRLSLDGERDRAEPLQDASTRPGARGELEPFLRRLAALVVARRRDPSPRARSATSLTEDVSVWNGLRLDPRHGRDGRVDPTPPDLAGQIVKVLLIVLGVGTLFYALVTVTEFFVAGHLGELLEERRTLKKIDALSTTTT